MLVIKNNVSLNSFNTLRIKSRAEFYALVNNNEQLHKVISWAQKRDVDWWLLGGGSNVVLPQYKSGLCIHLNLQGFELLQQDKKSVSVKIAAGEIWHNCLCYMIAQGWYGLENLAYIPGRVGAAPIQNIGAYGVELAQAVSEVHCLDCDSLQNKVLKPHQCGFAYRQSNFKHKWLNKYIITAVVLKLNKQFQPCLVYDDLKDKDAFTPRALVEFIGRLRASKLPNPHEVPNVGSFFCNPIIDGEQEKIIRINYPQLKANKIVADKYKVSAAWLIEQCGWKGFYATQNDAAVYHNHALVLINRGGASAQDILNLARRIQDSVHNKFGINLQIEPQVL